MLGLVGLALIALVAAKDVTDLVGGALRLVGALGPSTPEPSPGACRVIAGGSLLLAVGALFAAYQTLAWALDRPEPRPWANDPPGPRVWLAAALCLGLCAAVGLGATALFQGAVGLPIHLSWRAALAGGPLAVLVLLAIVFLLAS